VGDPARRQFVNGADRRNQKRWRFALVSLVIAFFCAHEFSLGQSTEFEPGRQLANSGTSPNAQQLLADLSAERQAIEKTPSSAEDHLELGRDLKALGETSAALQAFDRALGLNPGLAEACFEKATILADQDRWTEAEDLFARAIALSPKYAEAHVGLGEMFLRTGNFEGARKELNRALQLDATRASAYQGLGLIDLQQANPDAAERDFRHALAIRPQSTDAQSGLARSLIARHHWKEASELLKELLKQNPNATEDLVLLATALAKLGDQSSAQAEFAKARELSRRETMVLRAKGENNLGIALRSEGKLPEAAAAFRRASMEEADFCEAHDNLGGVLWLENDPTGALTEFQLAVACDPESASARNNLGNALLYSRHDLKGAIEQFRAALALRPGFTLAHLNLGKSLAASQDFADAEAEFREALAIDSDMAVAHVELGLLLATERGKVSPEAGAELEKGLRLDPKLRAGIPAEYLVQLQ
jgi:tetratricopeptide (TPR) repeat protein